MQSMKKPLQKLCDRVDNFLLSRNLQGRITGGTCSETRIQLFFTLGTYTYKSSVFRAIPELSQNLGFAIEAETGESCVILRMATDDVKQAFDRKPKNCVFENVVEAHYDEKTGYYAITAN